ncbi:MAG TPA: DUF6265 family protein [Casimicrobiaceae bacterium]|jgi:hypothetical protein|nr:DUF6265 family protein [Casimicrobiaceae bacterium]
MKKSLPTICGRSIRGLPARFEAVAPRIPPRLARCLAFARVLALASAAALTPALAQTPAATAQDAATVNAPAEPPNTAAPTTPGSPTSALDPLGWLHGCWDGKVNQRDFREEWLPLRGDMMIGVSQTVLQGKTQDFEYLRLELRPEGVFYVAVPSGKKETSFRLSDSTRDGDSEIFTFENPVDEFPQRIIYRRGSGGSLYAHVEGKLNGQPRSVIYPMRRVDCASGEPIRR